MNIKFNTPVISIPEKLSIIDKKGKIKKIKTLTKSNNLSTNNKLKSIQIKTNNNNEFKIITSGEDVKKNDVYKLKKSELKKIDIIDNIKPLNIKVIEPNKPKKAIISTINNNVEKELSYKEKEYIKTLDKVKKLLDNQKNNEKIKTSLNFKNSYYQLKEFYNYIKKRGLTNQSDKVLLLNYYDDLIYRL